MAARRQPIALAPPACGHRVCPDISLPFVPILALWRHQAPVVTLLLRSRLSPSLSGSPSTASALPSLSSCPSPTCFLKDFSQSPFSALHRVPATFLIFFYADSNYLGTRCVPGSGRGDPTPAWHFRGVGGGVWGGRQIVRKKICRSGKLQSPKSELFPHSSSSGGWGQDVRIPGPEPHSAPRPSARHVTAAGPGLSFPLCRMARLDCGVVSIISAHPVEFSMMRDAACTWAVPSS